MDGIPSSKHLARVDAIELLIFLQRSEARGLTSGNAHTTNSRVRSMWRAVGTNRSNAVLIVDQSPLTLAHFFLSDRWHDRT